MFRLGFILGAILILSSCGTDDGLIDKKNELDYFPLTPGTWFEYKVDSIDFLSRPYDTLTYWIREVVKNEVSTLENKDYNQIYVYKKLKWTDKWQKVRTDYARVDEEGAYRYAENIMHMKQTYPVATNLEWNSTPFNDVSDRYGNGIDFKNSKYVKVNDYHLLNGVGYDSILNIEVFSHYDLINRIDFRERYANHIGLYRKFELNAEFQPIDPEGTDSLTNMEPNSGYKYTQTLINYKVQP